MKLVIAAFTVLSLASGCASVTPDSGRTLGPNEPLGKGSATSFAEFDGAGVPRAIGVILTGSALDGLPAGSDNHRCHARNKDGMVDSGTKCIHSYEHVIPLPAVASRRADIPFKWVLLNWNPSGHIPPGVYDLPHFDIHFMMAPIAKVFAIEAGPCGPEFVRCDQFKIGKKPLPANFIHVDFKDVDAVVPAMGNHLIDLTGPEFNKQGFTRSWIYGVYDGQVIFYEEMVSRAHMLNKPNSCSPIKAPRAFAVRGYYPTMSCIRHDAATGEHTVSMEQFVLREASPPER